MTDILICGVGGKMGRVVAELAAADAEHFRVVAGVDQFAAPEGFSFPLFRSAEECDVRADAVVDFSRPDALGGILAYCRKFHCGEGDCPLSDFQSLPRHRAPRKPC